MRIQVTDSEKTFKETHIRKDYYPKCTKNSKNSTGKWTQWKSGQKTWTQMSPKKLYRWQTGIQKDTLQLMCPGKCKLKQWDTTTHLVEWPKSETLTPPNTGEDVEQHELSFTAGENTNRCSHFGRQFNSSLQNQNKHILTIRSSNQTPWYLPNELKTYGHTKTSTKMFIAALFTTAQTWKQTNGSSVGE